MDRRRNRLVRVAGAGAVMLGLAAGSYGVAAAATGSGSGSASAAGSSSASALGSTLGTAGSSGSQQSGPWGGRRPDETLLTGDTASKVQAAATAKVSGATVVRVETDADGHAACEVHMVKADGTPVTVYVDEQFDVVGVETGMPGPPQQQQA
jgi:hypothetical protein